jgi:hypothetical protein
MMMLIRNRDGKLKWFVVVLVIAFMAIHMLLVGLAGSSFAGSGWMWVIPLVMVLMMALMFFGPGRTMHRPGHSGAEPEQRPDNQEHGYRDKRLLTWQANEQPGAEERDRAEGRHIEPSRLQGAQPWSGGPCVGGVQGPDGGPGGGQRETDG